MLRPLHLLVVLAACSKATPTPPADTDSDTTPGIPQDTFVPGGGGSDSDTDGGSVIHPSDDCKVPSSPGLAGVCDQSAGAASVFVDTAGKHPLVLQVQESGPGQPGAFNGAGFGHRAIGGFAGYNRVKLSELGNIEVVGENVQGGFSLTLGLQVDLGCGTHDHHLLEVPFDRVIDAVDAGDGRTRYRLPQDAPIWSASEAITGDAGTLLEKTTATGGQGRSLLALLAAWPDACLRNVDAGFPDLPHNVVMSGLFLGLGSRVTYGQGALWEVVEVKVGGDDHLPPP